jgi:uncharacterized protein (DUF305 family)
MMGSMSTRSFLPQSPTQWVLGLTAFAFLAAAVGYFVGTRETAAPPAESAEVGFLHAMSAHHQQALVLADIVLVNGDDPAVARVATEIVRAQSYEIGLMTMRLDTWGRNPADLPDAPMEWMGMDGPVGEMPGLASAAELDALRQAAGAEADALFIALMRDHHLGGIVMAEAAAGAADDEWVASTAAAMARNQSGEVREMEQLRDTLGLSADPAGYVADEVMDMDGTEASTDDEHHG